MKFYRFLMIFLYTLITATLASAGEIKFVTYLSDPRAASVYDRLHLPPGPVLPDECSIGMLYVKQDDGKVYFCNKNAEWVTFGTVWFSSDNSEIYPNDTWTNANLQVGIGLTNPSHSFEVRDTSASSHVMFFDADKAAFRAGNDSEAWSSGKIGEFSTAFGNQTEASGRDSFAGGSKSVASGENSFAFGNQAQASGESSMALGTLAKVSGNHSVVFGAGENSKADLARDNTASFLGGPVVIGAEKLTSSSQQFDQVLQIYHGDKAMISVKTKAHDYKMMAVADSTSFAGDVLQKGFYILDDDNNKVLLSVGDADHQIGFGDSDAQYDFDVNGDMRIDGLAGEGHAYACVDKDGVIYRSVDVCVQSTELIHIVCPKSVADPSRRGVPDYKTECVGYDEYVGAGCDMSITMTIKKDNYLIELVPIDTYAQYPDQCSGKGGCECTQVCVKGVCRQECPPCGVDPGKGGGSIEATPALGVGVLAPAGGGK